MTGARQPDAPRRPSGAERLFPRPRHMVGNQPALQCEDPARDRRGRSAIARGPTSSPGCARPSRASAGHALAGAVESAKIAASEDGDDATSTSASSSAGLRRGSTAGPSRLRPAISPAPCRPDRPLPRAGRAGAGADRRPVPHRRLNGVAAPALRADGRAARRPGRGGRHVRIGGSRPDHRGGATRGLRPAQPDLHGYATHRRAASYPTLQTHSIILDRARGRDLQALRNSVAPPAAQFRGTGRSAVALGVDPRSAAASSPGGPARSSRV